MLYYDYGASIIYLDMIAKNELFYLRSLCLKMKMDISEIKNNFFTSFAVDSISSDLQKNHRINNNVRNYYCQNYNPTNNTIVIKSKDSSNTTIVLCDKLPNVTNMNIALFNAKKSNLFISIGKFNISENIINASFIKKNTIKISDYVFTGIEQIKILDDSAQIWFVCECYKIGNSKQVLLVHLNTNTILTCTTIKNISIEELKIHAKQFFINLNKTMLNYQQLKLVG